jgi:hypothetical protein
MKIMKSIIILTMVLAGLSAVSFAEEPDDTMGSKTGGDMMTGADKGSGMGSMQSMTGMMGNMVATSDGGVVVMLGNKLYKYDKNLRLVKKTEINDDMKKMQRMKNGGSGQDKGKADIPAAPEEDTGQEPNDQQ